MKLKLTSDEVTVVIMALQNAHTVFFDTKLESELIGDLIRQFLLKIMKKHIEGQAKTSISCDKSTLLALNHCLPQIRLEEPLANAIMSNVVQTINQACLSI